MNTPLSKSQMIAFAAPGLAVAWLIPPMYAILGDFYLRYTAATAAGVGTAMIVSKIVDAITDPPVGYLSDHTQTPLGARKPWIAAGALLSIPMFWFFFNPPEDAGNWYFSLGIIFYYLCYTLIKIPLRAWLGELAPDYLERNRIWSWFTIAMLAGGLVIMVLPIVLSSSILPVFDNAEFDREVISFLGWVVICLMPITFFFALRYVPQGTRNAGQETTVREFFNILLECAPYRTFLLGYGLSALGFGVFYSVIIIALTSYYGFSERVPLIMLVMIVVQVASIPLWERLARKQAKHRLWAYAWLGHGFFMPVFFLFGHNTPHFWPLVACGAITSILQAPHMLFPVPIMSDVVDYDTMKNHTSRSGNMFALFTFFDKVLHAIGFGVGYYLLAVSGYNAKLAENTDMGVLGLMTAVVVVPALLFLCSAFVLFKFPIDQRRHAIIRRRIDRRQPQMV